VVTLFVAHRLVSELRVQRRLIIEAGSVGELLLSVDKQVEGFRDSVCDEIGRIRANVNVFVNGVNVSSRVDALSTPLRDSDRVHILPSVAGGTGEVGNE